MCTHPEPWPSTPLAPTSNPQSQLPSARTVSCRTMSRYDLRYSCASRALARGESLAMIGKLLGHHKVQTTALYAHLARDSVRVAAERVSVSLGTDLEPAPDGSAVT